MAKCFFILTLLLFLNIFFSYVVGDTLDENLWQSFNSTLGVGRAHGAVLFVNGSFFVVGGCADPFCAKMVDNVDIIDPRQEKPVRHVNLPPMLDINLINKNHSNVSQFPFTVAGPSAMMRVDNVRKMSSGGSSTKSSSDDGENDPYALYIVGPCVYYVPHHDESVNSSWHILQKYSGIWRLSNNLSHVMDVFNIYPHMESNAEPLKKKQVFPFRVNATCVARGHIIWIIGGVDINTGKALETVDIYNTATRKYTRAITGLIEGVQNPLVAIDNEIIFVAGGKSQPFLENPSLNCGVENVTFGDQTSVFHFVNCSKYHTGEWVLSSNTQMIFSFNMSANGLINYAENDLKVCFVFALPPNQFLSTSGLGADTDITKNDIASVFGYDDELIHVTSRYMFIFNGKLCIFVSDGLMTCLNIEEFLASFQYQNADVSGWENFFFPKTDSSPVLMYMPFTFPLSAVISVYELAFFKIGGFDRTGNGSTQIFYQSTGLRVISVSKVERLVKTNTLLNFTLFPSTDGFVRLSNNLLCVGNTAGTHDTPVIGYNKGSAVVSFYPTIASSNVYVCFANKPVFLQCTHTKCSKKKVMTFLYTPITFMPFSVTNNPPANDDDRNMGRSRVQRITIAFCVVTTALTVVLLVLVFLKLRNPTNKNEKYTMHLLYDQEGDLIDHVSSSSVSIVVRKQIDDAVDNVTHNRDNTYTAETAFFDPKSERDYLVENTTHNSRYKVLQRIGEGAFSSVYLVERKDDGKHFALKYLTCKDNKERLNAIRECETVNTLQGHPNIIRLVDMFMNYEFDNVRVTGSSGVVSNETAAATATEISPEVLMLAAKGKNRTNHYNLATKKETQQKENVFLQQSFKKEHLVPTPSFYVKEKLYRPTKEICWKEATGVFKKTDTKAQNSDIFDVTKQVQQQRECNKEYDKIFGKKTEMESSLTEAYSSFYIAAIKKTKERFTPVQKNQKLLRNVDCDEEKDFGENRVNVNIIGSSRKKMQFQEGKTVGVNNALNDRYFMPIQPELRRDEQPSQAKQPLQQKVKCGTVARDFLLLSVAFERTQPVKRQLNAPIYDPATFLKPGASDGKRVHTRYLCLVMEYHPLGDLCGYVLRNSAKHNYKLRRQLLEKMKMHDKTHNRNVKVTNNSNKNCASDDAMGRWVQLAYCGSRLSSILSSPGLPESCCHNAEGRTLLDYPSSVSRNATAGSMSNTDNLFDSDELCTNNESNAGLWEKGIEGVFFMQANAFTERQLLSIAYQLSSVLHFLHSQRMPIVHRDLKPENILIYGRPHRNGSNSGNTAGNREEVVEVHCQDDDCINGNDCSVKFVDDVIPIVVTDFGLAFLQEEQRIASRGGGTRPYIAPECWYGQTTTVSDVWSLGCVLYALATARITTQTARLMYEEAKREGFAEMVVNDILAEGYSLPFAKFVLSLLVVDVSKRPSAQAAMHCFVVKDDTVRFNPDCGLFVGDSIVLQTQ